MKKQFVLPLAAMLIALPALASGSTISLSTSALSFNGSAGNVTSQPITIKVSGSQPVTIKSISMSNGAFSVPSVPMPLTLGGGQSVTGQISAQPKSTAQTGKLTISTSAGTYIVSLNETAIASSNPSNPGSPSSHQVNLSWHAPASSPDAIDSYQVNRAVSGSTAYSVVGTTTAGSTVFTDTSVQSGQSYVYQVRSVDQSGNASTPSNSVALSIP